MNPEDYSLIQSLWDRVYDLEKELRFMKDSYKGLAHQVVKLTDYISQNINDEPEARLGDYTIESAIALLKKYRVLLNK